jgi:hypothetical protein
MEEPHAILATRRAWVAAADKRVADNKKASTIKCAALAPSVL